MEPREQTIQATGKLHFAPRHFESEERFRTLLELSPDGVIVHVRGEIVYANPAALRIAGVQHLEDVVGSSIYEYLRPKQHEMVAEHVQKVEETGAPASVCELHVVRPDGQEVDIEAISAPVPWLGEEAIQAILHDITGRKKAERELRESEARLHELADSMPQIVWIADPGGKFVYCNKRFLEQTGLQCGGLSPDDCWNQFLHADDAKITQKHWEKCISEGIPFEMEYRYRTLTPGEYRWYLGRALPIKNEKGEIIRWYGTCTDIHAQKMAEFELTKTKDALSEATRALERKVDRRTERLRKSTKAMEEFCYNIAHNLRAPVRAMQGFAHALLEDYDQVLDEHGRDYTRRIHRAAANMDSLIRDLLSYGRLDHQDPTPRPLNVEKEVEKALTEFVPDIDHRKAEILVGNLDLQVLADESMLNEILLNFIGNALKFVHSVRRPRIQIWAEDRGAMVRITVRDNGIGISPDHQPRIFNAFERLHPQDDYPGTGIGLAIARKAAERMGGTVGVESEIGVGSCFWAELPRAEK